MATAKKQTAKSKSLKFAEPEIMDEDDIHKKIEVEAYLLAEKRGFQGGDPVKDWYMAEEKINNESGAGV
jgi:hypothetical protein